MATRWPLITGAEPWSHPGDGGDIGVVVVHGFTTNPNSTRPLGERLAERGFAVEVPRLPGHGTHWRDLARTRYADWRAEVERVYRDLAQRSEKVVLAGHSLGGTLALDIAAGHCRTDPRGPLAGVVTINAQVLDRDEPLARAAPVLQHLVPVVPRALADLPANDIAKSGGDEHAYGLLPSKAAYSFVRELPRIRGTLGDVSVPVLVAWSSVDHTVPPENSRAICELVGCEDLTELELRRSYHVAMLDHDAELLADEIAAFVERVCS